MVEKGRMAIPGDVVKCTEIEAMCINTMQAMTLRDYDKAGVDYDRQNR